MATSSPWIPRSGTSPTADVLVRDGVIAEVGAGLETSVSDAEVIEAKGRLVIPGLVDTHRHVWQGAIGGFTPQMTGAGYGPAVLTGIAPKHSADDVYAGTLWGALQALDAGITTIADWAHNLQSAAHADADLRGLQESGIRGYFLYGGPGPASDDPNPPHPLDARRMRDEQFSAGTKGRLRMGMALRGPCFTSAERNAADFAFARELGLPISLHVGMAGTADAITTLERFGLLGPDVNYAHGNMLTDEEFDLIAASRGTLSISPSTDMLMQFGTYPGTGRALRAEHRVRIRGGHHLQRRDGPVLRNAPGTRGGAFPGQRLSIGPRRAGPDRRPTPARHASSGYSRRRAGVES